MTRLDFVKAATLAELDLLIASLQAQREVVAHEIATAVVRAGDAIEPEDNPDDDQVDFLRERLAFEDLAETTLGEAFDNVVGEACEAYYQSPN